MTDLTRLMFDDGATRAPVKPRTSSCLPEFTVRYRGRMWRMIPMEDVVDGQDIIGVSMYGPSHPSADSTWWGIKKLIEDTEYYFNLWFSRRTTPTPGIRECVSQTHIDSGIVFYQFEEVL